MALSITNRGTGTHNTGASSFTLSPGSNFAAGATAVLCVAADNSSSGGATNDFTTVTDSLGNTWTKRQSPVFDNGAASAGVQGAIYDTLQNVGTLQTSTVITVNFGSSPVAKTWTITEIAPAAGKAAKFRTGADKSAGATGTALTGGASPTVNIGEVLVACFYMEAGTTQSVSAADTDTTNGSWTTNQYAEIGSTTSGSCIISQAKLQTTANSTQTYDVTVGISSDYHGSYAIYQELTFYSLSVAAGSFTETGTAATPEYGRLVAASSGSFAETGTAATLEIGHRLSSASGSFAETGTAATLGHGYPIAAASGSFTETGTSATVKVGHLLSAASSTFSESGTAATLEVGRVISATSGSYTETGSAATLIYTQNNNRTLSASSGSFSETGTSATLEVGHVLSAGTGSIAESGTSAIIIVGHLLSGSAGSFAETGTDAGLVHGSNSGVTLTAEPGAASISGSYVTLVYRPRTQRSRPETDRKFGRMTRAGRFGSIWTRTRR